MGILLSGSRVYEKLFLWCTAACQNCMCQGRICEVNGCGVTDGYVYNLLQGRVGPPAKL